MFFKSIKVSYYIFLLLAWGNFLRVSFTLDKFQGLFYNYVHSTFECYVNWIGTFRNEEEIFMQISFFNQNLNLGARIDWYAQVHAPNRSASNVHCVHKYRSGGYSRGKHWSSLSLMEFYNLATQILVVWQSQRILTACLSLFLCRFCQTKNDVRYFVPIGRILHKPNICRRRRLHV